MATEPVELLESGSYSVITHSFTGQLVQLLGWPRGQWYSLIAEMVTVDYVWETQRSGLGWRVKRVLLIGHDPHGYQARKSITMTELMNLAHRPGHDTCASDLLSLVRRNTPSEPKDV